MRPDVIGGDRDRIGGGPGHEQQHHPHEDHPNSAQPSTVSAAPPQGKARKRPGGKPRKRDAHQRLVISTRELFEGESACELRTDVELAQVAQQVQPSHPGGQRKHGEQYSCQGRTAPVTPRRVAVTAIVLAWLVVGLYGAVSYGHNYYVYRGFDAPRDPPGIPAGREATGRFFSSALHQRRSYLVFLPPGYAAAAAHGRHYPVLYLLHGTPGWPRQFLDIARAGVQLDVFMARGEIRPMLLVMPDGRSGDFRSDTEWADTGRGRYASLVLETVRAVDRHFATRRGRAFRAIAGNSEGAYGAVNLALRHLATFSIVGSWSGYFGQRRKGPFAHASAAEIAANSPAGYVSALAPQLRRRPIHAYMYAGLVDPDRPKSTDFARRLRAAGGKVRYVEYPGRHSWRLWRDETPNTLRYADQWFGGEAGKALARAAPS